MKAHGSVAHKAFQLMASFLWIKKECFNSWAREGCQGNGYVWKCVTQENDKVQGKQLSVWVIGNWNNLLSRKFMLHNKNYYYLLAIKPYNLFCDGVAQECLFMKLWLCRFHGSCEVFLLQG